MKRLLTALFGLLLVAAPAAHAQFYYVTNADGVTITITGYYGPPGYPVAIPPSINNLTVTEIGTNAFSGDGVTGVTIPGGVTNIEDGAFYNCTNLTDATIASGVTTLGYAAFANTGLSSVTIPGSVADLGTDAFSGCPSLTNVTIASGVNNIGDYAFYACPNLTNVTLPGSITNPTFSTGGGMTA